MSCRGLVLTKDNWGASAKRDPSARPETVRAAVQGAPQVPTLPREPDAPVRPSHALRALRAAPGDHQVDVRDHVLGPELEGSTHELGAPAMFACEHRVHFLDIVAYLHANQSEGCITDAVDQAAARGLLKVVQFLHQNRAEGCTASTLHGMVVSGHAAVVRLLCENRQEGCLHSTLLMDTQKRHAGVVKLLSDHNRMLPIVCFVGAWNYAVERRNTHLAGVLERFKRVDPCRNPQHLLENGQRVCQTR